MAKKAGNLPSLFMGYSLQSSNSSRVFQSFIRELAEASSRHEEDRLIRKELSILKEKLTQPNISPKQMREFLLRLIYCEMLGFDASFGYIQAIKFAQQSNLMCKRVGYLALSLFLNEDHQLIVLLINTLQKDLKSTNVMEVCCALTVACKLISKDMLPALLPQVVALLVSKRDIVRKKAVMALHRFYHKSPVSFPEIKSMVNRALGDKDFGVVGASLNLLYDLVVANPCEYKSLVPTLVKIQREIVERKVPDFDYHDFPAPWMQIKLLRILGLLGADDVTTSEAMYEVLKLTLLILKGTTSAIYAVAYESVKTITAIYPNKFLLEKAAKCVGLFLVSKSNNIKYLGINTLAALIQVNPSVAAEPTYQRGVIDCLDDPDETLKRKTLDLLCHITNATNVESVCEKLIAFLRGTDDSYFKTNLVARVIELAERYAPDNQWYILTMNELFELGGALVQEGVAHNLVRLIAEGNEDEESDEELRRFAVSSYMDLLDKPQLPDILVRVISWVLGEYSYTAPEYEPQVVLEELCSLLNRTFEDDATKGWIITAIGKIIAQFGQGTKETQTLLDDVVSSVDVDLRQRCSEILQLQQDVPLMKRVLPEDASCEDLEIDPSLSILDEFVSQAMLNGAMPYKPSSQRESVTQRKDREPLEPASSLNFAPYENPSINIATTVLKPGVKEQDMKPDVPKKANIKPTSERAKVVKSDKLFAGVSAWGPGGYSKLRGRTGSAESSEKSDSSSTGSGSERQPIKTQSTPSPSASMNPANAQRDALASQLFRGVSNKNQPSLPRRRDAERSVKPQESRQGVRHVTNAQKKSNVDLLLDLGGTDPVESAASQNVTFKDILPSQDKNELSLVAKPEEQPREEEQLVGVESVHEIATEPPENVVPAVSLLDSTITETTPNLKISGASLDTLPRELENSPHSFETIELCTDSNLRVSLQKVWKADELILVVFLTNQSQNNAPISDVTCVFEPPSNLLATFDSGSNNTLQDGCIESSMSVSHNISLKYRSPALHMNFGGKVVYKDSLKTKRTLFFDHVVSTSDLLCPLVIETDEFEQRWSEAAFEKRGKLVSSVKTVDKLAEKTTQELRLHPVETIGAKMIAAGKVIGSTIFLLHGSLAGATLEVMVKSNNRLLNDALLRQCETVFR